MLTVAASKRKGLGLAHGGHEACVLGGESQEGRGDIWFCDWGSEGWGEEEDQSEEECENDAGREMHLVFRTEELVLCMKRKLTCWCLVDRFAVAGTEEKKSVLEEKKDEQEAL